MTILFICKANVGRSQMAEAFLAHLAPHHKAMSAGVDVWVESEGKPLSTATTKVIETMKQAGIDVSNQVRNALTPAMVEEADRVISMAPKETLPEYLQNSRKLEMWDIPDAGGTDLEFHHKIRDMVKEKVDGLAKSLDTKEPPI